MSTSFSFPISISALVNALTIGYVKDNFILFWIVYCTFIFICCHQLLHPRLQIFFLLSSLAPTLRKKFYSFPPLHQYLENFNIHYLFWLFYDFKFLLLCLCVCKFEMRECETAMQVCKWVNYIILVVGLTFAWT